MKEKIRDLRRAGLPLAAIAQMTGESISSVKVWCSRNKVRSVVYQECLCCGKTISQAPKRKRRKFCCDKCKQKWWNRHHDLIGYGKD